MDFVSCKIALGGDTQNVLYRGPDNPVSWPEVAVLQFLHGEDSVFDCEFVRAEEVASQEEKMRLLGKYGANTVNTVFPGARARLDGDFPGEKNEATQKRPERQAVPVAKEEQHPSKHKAAAKDHRNEV